MALVRIVRCAVLEASYQPPGVVWDRKSVRAGDGVRWVSKDVVDDHLHDSSETDDDEWSEELTDISGDCTQLQCEVLQELEERGRREGMEGGDGGEGKEGGDGGRGWREKRKIKKEEKEKREEEERGGRGREGGGGKEKENGERDEKCLLCCFHTQISRLCFVELTRALNWRHSATRSAKSSSPAPVPPRSTLAILLPLGPQELQVNQWLQNIVYTDHRVSWFAQVPCIMFNCNTPCDRDVTVRPVVKGEFPSLFV